MQNNKTATIVKNLIVVLATALCFFIITMPFRNGMFKVLEATEFRPVAGLNTAFGMLWGFWGAFGCALGNFIADMVSGYGLKLSVVAFFPQLIYGLIPYVLWKLIVKKNVRMHRITNFHKYIFMLFVACVFIALSVGALLKAFYGAPLWSLSTLMIFLNDMVFSLILGVPIIIIGTILRYKSTGKGAALNEKYILLFILLGALSAVLVGYAIYRETSPYLVDPDNLAKMWDVMYIYIFVVLSIFWTITGLFMAYAEKTVTVPIERISKMAKRYVNSDKDAEIYEFIKEESEALSSTPGEVGYLSNTFSNMVLNIKDYVNQLTTVTAEKERIGAELSIANHIQLSLVPTVFPDTYEYDVYATMTPAKEVGGDFYDFFMVDDTHLAVVMADVSGKGVPAALFMAIGKTLIKNATKSGRDLGEIFMEVNNTLCESNSEGFFITAFLGVLDLKTGHFDYVNAGHEKPAIYRKGQEFKLEEIKAGFVLAGMEDMKYKQYSINLKPGDRVYLYTDGVTEATSENTELFGEDRLVECLNKNIESSPSELLKNIKSTIDEFVGNAPQFDDITMLCLDYKEKIK